MVDELGIVWAHETAAELGMDLSEVAAAFWAARQVIGAGTWWSALEDRSAELSADAEAALHATISQAVATLARVYLTSPGAWGLGGTIERDAVMAGDVARGVLRLGAEGR